MPRCAANKPDGQRCATIVDPQQEYCYWHDPARAAQRKRNASKGGKARANRELQEIKTLLSGLTEQVLAGDLDTGRAAVANQLINTRLRAIEQERKNKETEDLEARIEALERSQEHRGGSRWRGA